MALKSVRILVISDTHTAPLGKFSQHAFREPLPDCDVLIHAGDLTNRGTLDEYKETLQMLRRIRAELKLVIAGNHDLTLDRDFVNRSVASSEQIPTATIEQAEDLWSGEAAKDAGVTFLNEGLHQFILKSGAKFSVYASPYTPEFCNWAFDYKRDEDRWNPPGSSMTKDTLNIAKNPIPDFPAVDIVITHGPPKDHRGRCYDGYDAGCSHLLHALKRVKPRLHCFGHIHEAWGAERLDWIHERSTMYDASPIKVDKSKAKTDHSARLDVSSSSDNPLKHGQSTLLINAAIMNVRYQPTNAPWLIDMDFCT
ncbi:MAG: hypothetical protein M1828_007077 [Chrysothrix sp. TS-e1954]|nr:MAG: hypothetical protein M1828_007077 [Chrysothrix sp. TS-e1954]